MEDKSKNIQTALSFDDVLLKPGYAYVSRSEIDLSTCLTRKIKLTLPLVSSPMDTVTESKLAIALAEVGGIGILHRNLSTENQVKQVKEVKKTDQIVGAATSAAKGFEPRVDTLIKAGVDVILLDAAHGYTKPVIEASRYIKRKYKVQLIAGNVATYEGAKALIEAGVDSIRVGMGPGAICTTRIISGMGVPQITAIMETFRAAKKEGVPVIADGGIKYSGDIVKALAAGADTVMIGSLFASCEESPGEITDLDREHVPARFQSILNGSKTYKFKTYRAMGSEGAMKEGAKVKVEDEFHGKDYLKEKTLVAEGVEGLVPIKGTVREVVAQLVGGIKSGFYYVGAENLKDLQRKARLLKITQASLTESHPHDILITNPGKNY